MEEVEKEMGKFLKRLAVSDDIDFAEFDSLDEKVQDALVKCVVCALADASQVISDAQSPIEQLMGFALFKRAARLGAEFIADRNNFIISQQEPVRVGKHNYRCDFLVAIIYRGVERKIVVECDGHDYHERNKKQAAKDKSRDREMQASGYKVFRFTGSEIWADADKCAKEVFSALLSDYWREGGAR